MRFVVLITLCPYQQESKRAMIGAFKYNILLGPYEQERLQAIIGDFVLHYNCGALSAGVINGDDGGVCYTIKHY